MMMMMMMMMMMTMTMTMTMMMMMMMMMMMLFCLFCAFPSLYPGSLHFFCIHTGMQLHSVCKITR